MKAEPSPFKPITAEGKKVAEEMVEESKNWFFSLVRTRRKIDTSKISGLEQGRVFSGREAKRLNLIDEIGGEDVAIKWLETKAKQKVAPDLDVIDWKPESDTGLGLLGMSMSAVQAIFGLKDTDASQLLHRARQGGMIPLDGLVSVWHFRNY